MQSPDDLNRMKGARMIGIILGCLLTLLIAVCPCHAGGKTLVPALELSTGKTAPTKSFNDLLYGICLSSSRIDFDCLTRITPEDYARGVGLSHTKPSSLDDRLNATLAPFMSYKSCRALCNAMLAGAEFYDFSREITTYGKSSFHTGYSLKNTPGSSFKTGLFLNF